MIGGWLNDEYHHTTYNSKAPRTIWCSHPLLQSLPPEKIYNNNLLVKKLKTISLVKHHPAAIFSRLPTYPTPHFCEDIFMTKSDACFRLTFMLHFIVF